MSARLLSIQVGLPASHRQPGDHKAWRTAFWKAPVEGPVWLGVTNLVGDRQAALRIHGGPDLTGALRALSAAWRHGLASA